MKIRLVFAVVGVLFGSICSAVAQQADERVIVRLPIEKNEPLVILETKVNGRSIPLGQKFTANEDWIRGLVFVVKNTSDKRILFASIDLFFASPISAKARFEVFYGSWALQNRPPKPGEQLAGMLPGETAEIGFSDQRFAGFTRFLQDISLVTVSKIDMRIGSVIFEDDTMWSRSEYFRRDPINPSSWNSISR